jgi:hypothetical protein
MCLVIVLIRLPKSIVCAIKTCNLSAKMSPYIDFNTIIIIALACLKWGILIPQLLLSAEVLSYFIKRNDILTTTFWQLLDNFLSHTHMMLLSSLFLFLSPLFLTNKKWEKQGCQQICHQMDVKISLLFYQC